MSAVNSSAAAASQRIGLSASDLARAPPGNRSLNSAMAAHVLNEMAVTTKSSDYGLGTGASSSAGPASPAERIGHRLSRRLNARRHASRA